MKISFWIPAVVLHYAVRIVLSNCIQVGTVLFTTTDLVKKCWSESDKALLRARLIMQDFRTLAASSVVCQNALTSFFFSCLLSLLYLGKPDMVLTLLDYFQSCYDIIGISTYGNLQNLMYLALSDAVGGYLRGYALPLTKRAYYEGHVKYSEAKKMFQLYDEIKAFLNTNGMGWTKPQKLCKSHAKVKPLVIGNGGCESACDQLYTIEKKSASRNCCILNLKSDKYESRDPNPRDLESKLCQANTKTDVENTESPRGNDRVDNSSTYEETNPEVKRRRVTQVETADYENDKKVKGITERQATRSAKGKKMEKRKCKFEASDCEYPVTMYNKVIVPLPVLEDCEILNTIAVPFKVRPLRNVQTRRSAFILEHYYITVLKCLMSKCSHQKDIRNFNALFYSWLVTQVFPHLTDEQWYPAFGGVHRIVETIKKLGVDSDMKEYGAQDIGFIFTKGLEFADEDEWVKIGKDQIRDVGEEFEGDGEDEEEEKPKKYFIFSIAVLGIVWLCAFFACVSYCCAHRLGRRTTTPTPSQSSTSKNENDVLFNFQSLLKFFKKKEASNTDTGLPPNVSYEYKKKDDRPFKRERNNHKRRDIKIKRTIADDGGDNNNNKENKMETQEYVSDMKQNMKFTGTGNIPRFLSAGDGQSKQFFQPVLSSAWPCQGSFMQLDKLRLTEKSQLGRNPYFPLDSKIDKISNKLQKPWKNQFKMFSPDREIKGKENCNKEDTDERSKEIAASNSKASGSSLQSSGKRCFSCDCTESSNSSCFTSTSSSLKREPFNANPMKIYKKVKGKRKTIRRRTVEVCTQESESEDASTGAGESDSTETTHNWNGGSKFQR